MIKMVMKLCLFCALAISSSSGRNEEAGYKEKKWEAPTNIPAMTLSSPPSIPFHSTPLIYSTGPSQDHHVDIAKRPYMPPHLRLETKDLVSRLVWNVDEKWNESVNITYTVETCDCVTDCSCNCDECEWDEKQCNISENYEIDGTKTLSCQIPDFLGFNGYARVIAKKDALWPRKMRKRKRTKRKKKMKRKMKEKRKNCFCEDCLSRMSDLTSCISASIRMEFSEPELFPSMISSDEAKFTFKFPVKELFCEVKVYKVRIDYHVYKLPPVYNATYIKIKEENISFPQEKFLTYCNENVSSRVIELIDLEPETEYIMTVSFTVFDDAYFSYPSETTSLNFTTLSALTMGVPIVETVINHETDNRRSNILQIVIICVLLVVVLWIVLCLTHYKIRTICRSQQTHWKPPEFVDLESYLNYLFNGDEFSVGGQFHDDHPVDLISKYPVEEQASSPQIPHIPAQELPDELEFSPEENLINVDVNSQDQIITLNNIYEHSAILTSSNPSGFSSGYVAKESL